MRPRCRALRPPLRAVPSHRQLPNRRLTVSTCSTPQLVDRPIEVLVGEWHVIEAAAEGIVLTHGGPVDTHSGIDGGFNVFGLDVAVAGPAVLGRGRALVVGRADG